MKARRLESALRNLDAVERAQLTLSAYRDLRTPEPAVERTTPRGQRAAYRALMRFGLTVHTQLRPAAHWLEALTETLEVELELLQLRHAWAKDRSVLLTEVRRHCTEPSEREAMSLDELESEGPMVTDTGALWMADFRTFLDQEVTEEDVRGKLDVVRAVARLRRAWSTLLALEEALPFIAAKFGDREFADSLLGDQLRGLRARLTSVHAGLEALVGPVDLPEALPEAAEALAHLLRDP